MQITDHIHALKIPFHIPVGPGRTFDRFVYAYPILGPEICLIDSGVKGTENVIFDYLKKIGRQPEEISLLMLTHAHPDHIGAARSIKSATGCTVAAHGDGRAWIEDVELQFRERPVPGFHALVEGGTTVDRVLRDGEVVNLGPVSLQVIHTPGHGAGSVSMYCPEEKVLFSGDAVPQPDDLPIYEDAAAAAASITRLQAIPDVEHLLASWLDPVSGSRVDSTLADGLGYLQRIHTVIRDIVAARPEVEPMELCTRVVKILGLPEIAVNPLVARSFVSHLRLIKHERLH